MGDHGHRWPRLVVVVGGAALLPAAAAGAYGEEVDGFPTADERRVHLYTDMLRVDPMEFWDGAESYEPMPPLVYDADLNHAARAHAEDMRDNGCFQHESCDGTSMEARVSSYYEDWSTIGENIAQGYGSAWTVVMDGWLHSDGHRANMLHTGFEELGTGYAAGAGGPWIVQDFGTRFGGTEQPVLTSVADDGDGVDTAFYATYHHPDGVAPARVLLALEDRCEEMSLDVGAADMGVYSWIDADLADGQCHPYVVVAEIGGDERVLHPTEGALVAAGEGAECPSYQEERPAAPCLDEGLDGAGGCEPRACDTGTDRSIVSGNEETHTEVGSCSIGSRWAAAGRPFPALLIFGGVLLARRRLVR